MSDDVADPPRLLGLLLALLGVAAFIGGISQLRAGGNLYFVLVGIGVFASGTLITLGKRMGVYVYAATLTMILVWSFREAGSDIGQFIPRIALPSILGIYLFSAKVTSRLR